MAFERNIVMYTLVPQLTSPQGFLFHTYNMHLERERERERKKERKRERERERENGKKERKKEKGREKEREKRETANKGSKAQAETVN